MTTSAGEQFFVWRGILRTPLIAVATAICVVATTLLCFYARASINHDALSYVALARYWLSGQITLAVTGTWSPLFPLLLAPILAVVPDPILAARLLHSATAVLFFVTGLALLRRLVRPDMASVGALALACYAAVRSATWVIPDLLSAALFALYCRALLDMADGPFLGRRAFGAGVLLGLV